MSNPLDLQFNDFFGGEGGEAFTESSFFPDVEERYFMDAPGSFYGIDLADQREYDATPASSGQDDSEIYGLVPSGYDPQLEARGGSGFYALPPEDERTVAERIQEGVFGEEGALRALGLGAGAVRDIQGFFKGASKGFKEQTQGQRRGRVGPGLTTSTPRTSAAGRTSGARRTLSGQQSIERAIEQSRRATSAARAIASQMARAGTVTSTNDLADMISGATSPKGTKQALPGTRLRQLAIPRTA